ncbi:hypothetical protein ABGB17_20710 [Sphaerisporangium sp. B11E5]|uniref:hypothetical protein n=1 Tax=Sphaerisporangium sp. B11E5 TaxID=3153563 RepID=UPI00325E1B30
MRRLRALVVSVAIAAGVLFSFGSAPAQADSIRYVYYYESDCYNGGNLGIQWGWWTSYRCVATPFGYNEYRWFLWA